MRKFNEVYQSLIEKSLPDIAPEKRTLKNMPKYSTGKSKMSPGEWLKVSNGGRAANGSYYGWSHRAIAGFKTGDNVSGDSMAHKDYKWGDDETGTTHDSYKIKDDADAKAHAIRFMKAVS